MSAGPGSRSLAKDLSTEMTGRMGRVKTVSPEERPEMLQVQVLGEGSGNPCKGQPYRRTGRVGQLPVRLLQQGPSPWDDAVWKQCAACFTSVPIMLPCRGHGEPGCRLTGTQNWGSGLQFLIATVPWEEHSIPLRTKQQEAEAVPKQKEEPAVGKCL